MLKADLKANLERFTFHFSPTLFTLQRKVFYSSLLFNAGKGRRGVRRGRPTSPYSEGTPPLLKSCFGKGRDRRNEWNNELRLPSHLLTRVDLIMIFAIAD